MPSTILSRNASGKAISLTSVRAFAWLSAGFAVVALLAWWWLWPAKEPVSTAQPPAAREDVVTLSSAKLDAADLTIDVAERRSLQATRTVAGLLNYDPSRQLAVTTPVSGIVKQVLVDPGQAIEGGAPLAILTSSEIGVARDEIIKREADLDIARREESRAEAIAKNVEELVNLLDRRRPMAEIEKAMSNKVIGDHREKLLGSYSRLIVTEAAAVNTASLQEGVLSARSLQERKSAHETAAALFQTAAETARFDAAQQQRKAAAAADQADRLLHVSRDRLTAFLGEAGAAKERDSSQGLNDFVLPAPRSGRIDQRHVATGQRFEAGQPLFTLADTSVLWLSAEIHERDWSQLTVQVGEAITARVPALGEKSIVGKLRFVGAQVQADTRAVPLVAEVENPAGRLKPGMFAWIDVPISKTHEALAVPASAIVRQERETFVFVPQGEHEFRRMDVKLGVETRDYVEIQRGLKAGDRVVSQGAFYLKSELLLEREAD